ncbi:MAG TPA: Gfo/Idh/MocA family oxidoreductase [Methylomirabilota bacterium]|nr:Gfo/Idh/MocA family oxidoreductase [Methylomirabilota bacterium]
MKPRYRAVLVGCGARGQSHALGLLANPDRFELVALCDRDAERLGALAHTLGITRGYSDAEAMLAAERPDLLCFATPPAVRLELVELGVRHDVRAIAFEKPLALSLADARRIVALCAGGTKAVVCHQLKHAGHWRRVKQIVEEGGIGEIRSFHATARPSMLRAGTHVVDAMLWLGAGTRATSVLGQAHGRKAYLEDHPCPDHVAGVVEFASGARGLLEIGSLAPRHLDDGGFWGDVAVTVRGAEGYARVVLGGGWEAVTRRSGGLVQTGPADISPGEPEHMRLLADWLDDPRRAHPSNLVTSYHGFEILMGLALSSLERRRVDLPIPGTPEAILERLRDALPPDVLPEDVRPAARTPS